MRVRWLLFVAAVPLLVGAEGASDESQLRCEEAAARVIACCPHVAAGDLYCSQATRGCWDSAPCPPRAFATRRARRFATAGGRVLPFARGAELVRPPHRVLIVL